MINQNSKMPFGKYQGKLLKDLPIDYVIWLIEHGNLANNDPELYTALNNLFEIVKEQDGISLPWHPESEKPTHGFVICTNGEGHYWIGRYLVPHRVWISSTARCTEVHEGLDPLAWVEPEEFVPFVKKKRHDCINIQLNGDVWACVQQDDGLLYYYHTGGHELTLHNVKFCPFCGYEAKR